jgi:hypothetical protein
MSAPVTLPWITQTELDLAMVAVLGTIALGCLVCLGEWLAERLRGWVRKHQGSDLLPPPDRAAERSVFNWKEDLQ